MSEKTKFLTNKWNLIDIAIFIIVLISITIAFTHADWVLHNKDNALGAAIMVTRYGIQIYRVLMLLLVSKEIH